MTSKKIAIFGTSADPPTVAHQSILNWLGDHFDLVAVYASDNPFKEHSSTLIHRSQMLQLLIDDLKYPKNNLKLCQEISDRRSLNTINKAREKWGAKVEFNLVIGSDLITQINHWYKIEILLSKVNILVFSRPNYPLNNDTIKTIQKKGGKCQMININLPDISSTEYRKLGKENILTKKVNDYIIKHNLYSQ